MTRGLDSYPHTDPNGTVIPFDVGDVYGTMRIAVTGAASGAKTLPDAVIGLPAMLFATVRCIVALDGAAPAMSDDTLAEDRILVPKLGSVSVVLSSALINCVAEDGSSTGRLYVMIFRSWKNAGKDLTQLAR